MKHESKPGKFPWIAARNRGGCFPDGCLCVSPGEGHSIRDNFRIIRRVNNDILLYTIEIVNRVWLKNTDFPAAVTGTILSGVPGCIPVPAVPT